MKNFSFYTRHTKYSKSRFLFPSIIYLNHTLVEHNKVKYFPAQDIFVRLKYKSDKFFVGVDAHMFSAAADVFDSQKCFDTIAGGTPAADVPIESMSSGLGTEIDLSFGFNLAKGVSLKAGYSHMLGSSQWKPSKAVIKTNSATGVG